MYNACYYLAIKMSGILNVCYILSVFHFTQQAAKTEATFTVGNGPMGDNCLAQLHTVHPLSASEKNVSRSVRPRRKKNQTNTLTSNFVSTGRRRGARQHFQNEYTMNMQMLRSREGLHAPLKIAMERQAFKTVGRLPCLQSRYYWP